MSMNILEKVKNILNKKEEDINPFTSMHIIDRRVEKINQCRQCGTLFGKNYENVFINEGYYDGKKITQVICNKCNFIHNFINWNNK